MHDDIDFNPTHKGLFAGVVPIYLDMSDEECPAIVGRNALCDYMLYPVEALFGCFLWLAVRVIDDFEPSYPIKITGEVNG